MATTPIEHLVVLMLENRSFDNLLGFHLGELDGSQTQPLSCQSVEPTVPVTDDAPAFTPCSPGHALIDVNRQLFCQDDPAPDAVPTMSGFVSDYWSSGGVTQSCSDPKAPGPAATDPVRCFGPQSPVTPTALWTLAENFAVLDRWFSAVPGPTGPNRLFANCASSGGYAGPAYAIAPPPSQPLLPASLHSLPSVFGQLTAAGRSWAVYHEDPTFAPELILDEVQAVPGSIHCDAGLSQFFSAAAAGTLADYTFLTPSLWTDSQHPPCPITPGDTLTAQVYEALRSSPAWPSTMLLVTYDEHGGYYDHVPPPSGMPYDGPVWSSDSPLDFGFTEPAFDFTRWGVRVPAVVVSAYTPAGTDSTPYEHSSIVATVRELCGISTPLTVRDANAASFIGLASLAEARTDLPDLSGLIQPN